MTLFRIMKIRILIALILFIQIFKPIGQLETIFGQHYRLDIHIKLQIMLI